MTRTFLSRSIPRRIIIENTGSTNKNNITICSTVVDAPWNRHSLWQIKNNASYNSVLLNSTFVHRSRWHCASPCDSSRFWSLNESQIWHLKKRGGSYSYKKLNYRAVSFCASSAKKSPCEWDCIQPIIAKRFSDISKSRAGHSLTVYAYAESGRERYARTLAGRNKKSASYARGGECHLMLPVR